MSKIAVPGGDGNNFRNWHHRYHHDMLTETLGLTMEEYGQYTVILDLIFVHNGSIPDDAAFIRGPLVKFGVNFGPSFSLLPIFLRLRPPYPTDTLPP
jgi:hypothetical protein